VNREEARLLVPDPIRNLDEAAGALATQERLAVVTDGERGCAAAAGWIEKTIVGDAQAPGRPALDSTGAGDAFTASLIAALAPGWPPSAAAVAAALELAAREGAVTTTAIGAQSVAAAGDTGHDA
jgi:sugar/nucleoside kinase (ribokinase family)